MATARLSGRKTIANQRLDDDATYCPPLADRCSAARLEGERLGVAGRPGLNPARQGRRDRSLTT